MIIRFNFMMIMRTAMDREIVFMYVRADCKPREAAGRVPIRMCPTPAAVVGARKQYQSDET